MTEDIRSRLLAHLKANPKATIRSAASAIGCSPGNVRYHIKELIIKGLILPPPERVGWVVKD